MFDKTGKGLITWRELSSLLKALGIPDIPIGLLNRMSVEQTPENSPGLEYKPFLHLLQLDSFSSTLDYTYNRHNSTYNIRVMKKAISLIVDGLLSLEDLRSSRLGFTLYEGETCNGIQLEAAIITAAMRVTGKAIAPKKLQIWLDSVEEDVPGRLQFYEFLDLIKLCNDRGEQNRAVPNITSTVERSRIGLFDLTDSGFLLTPGQKLAKHMDDEYDGMVSVVNSQQIPPRETSAKKSSSPDYNNYLTIAKNSKRVEEGLDLYGQIRDTIKTSTSNVHISRSFNSSGTRSISNRPTSSAEERRSRLPTLHLNTSIHSNGKRGSSVPSLRSLDSQKTVRIAETDMESTNSREVREPIPRQYTSSAPLIRGGFTKDKSDVFDEGEFALPERRLEKYDTLREYISLNGESSLSRVITSSIGASHKQAIHPSPPSSPHFGRTEERKKKPKPKRAFEESRRPATRGGQPSHKDRFSVDSLSNNLEDIINANKPYNNNNNNIELARIPSTRKPNTPVEDDDIEPPHVVPTEGIRIRPRNESPARSITFNLNHSGD